MYYRWTQQHDPTEAGLPALWYLDIDLGPRNEWDLKNGRLIENWNLQICAYFDDDVELTDFPITSTDIPVCSPRLVQVLQREDVGGIQWLPLQVKHRPSGREVYGYQIANYLHVIDCLDRQRSTFQVWTKENLLFWEQRSSMLGTFRDVQKAVLDAGRIGSARLFRLWGWETMVLVREDVKQAMEQADITGCRFTKVEVAA